MSGFYVADLWLVHSAPDRDDEVLHTVSSVWPVARAFTFAPVTIHTSQGAVTVRIVGSVGVSRTPDGERFSFSARRHVTFVPSDRPLRDAVLDSDGTANVAVPVPGPDDVLSFEMPALQVPGGPAVPDRFAIRVRLTPLGRASEGSR